MAADLPTAAAVTSGTVTNAQQKLNLTAWINFTLGYLGAKFGIGPQTVASAATLDLEAVTDTRDLVISGAVTITAVTVEAGKVFRCRASGAFTLTNNAAIVTNTGANIICASGDTFTLRATAANTAEVFGYTQSSPLKNFVYIRDEKASGTAGGTATSGSFQTRTLNTEVSDTGSLATLSSNQVTLAAGTYIVEARAPAFAVGEHQARLQNITGGTTLLIGSSTYSSPTNPSQNDSSVEGVITVAAAQALELQHRVNTTSAGNGFGANAGFGITNIYSEVTFRKIA